MWCVATIEFEGKIRGTSYELPKMKKNNDVPKMENKEQQQLFC